jgi:hypothetical protein
LKEAQPKPEVLLLATKPPPKNKNKKSPPTIATAPKIVGDCKYCHLPIPYEGWRTKNKQYCNKTCSARGRALLVVEANKEKRLQKKSKKSAELVVAKKSVIEIVPELESSEINDSKSKLRNQKSSAKASIQPISGGIIETF